MTGESVREQKQIPIKVKSEKRRNATKEIPNLAEEKEK